MRSQCRWTARAWAAFLAVCAIGGCTAHRPLCVANRLPDAKPPDSRTHQAVVSSHPPKDNGADEFSVGHARIDDFVHGFKTRRRATFQDALERSGRYRLRMVAILAREGLPTELSYLPLIESGYRSTAESPAGAVGPWQFMRQTGRGYGLRIDGYVDERRDPIKSTRAAARYLRALHDVFGNWHLTLAAYNSGPGRITRAIARRGIHTFWEMGRALPRETIDYVPRFLAAVHIARAPGIHGFIEPDHTPLPYDLVRVRGGVSLDTVARMAGVSAAEIVELNPALIRSMTPPDRGGYRVRVPKGAKERFVAARAAMPPMLARS